METIVHNVRDLKADDRSAAERLVGHSLGENQKLVIQVVNLDLASDRPGTRTFEEKLPEWCNVYEGLSDEELADLEKTILTRAELSASVDSACQAVLPRRWMAELWWAEL